MSLSNQIQGQDKTIFHKALNAIQQQAAHDNQRAVVVLSGEKTWCDEHASLITDNDVNSVVEWVGKDQDALAAHKQHFSAKLGREVDILIFPLTPGFDANRLTALSGMIRGSGLLVFLLTKELWNSASQFDQRFIHALHQSGGHWLQEGKVPADLKLDSLDSLAQRTPSGFILCTLPSGSRHQGNDGGEGTDTRGNDELFLQEQNELVNKIFQVNQTEDKTTIVIQSDRGRGKSASLGLAAAKWLVAGEDVYLTGPSLKSVEQVFWHAQQALTKAELSRGCLSYQSESLQFLPPDAVHTEYENITRLLVDEAAAIPIPKLTDWLQHIPQLVFSTTIHGYEGTGKGFLLKFGKVLDQQRPDWKKFILQHPIRWASDDFLEQWLNKTFLLDSDIKTFESSVIENVTPTVIPEMARILDQSAPTIDKTFADEYLDSGYDLDTENNPSFPQRRESSQHINLEHYNSYNLASDDDLLQQVYGLLINAHYRTTPKDLRYLLDTETASIYALWDGQTIIAAGWLMYEGEFDQDLSDAVYLGTRRPPGHLLAQSLTYHCAIQDAATYRYARVVRIAVHPQCQRQGLGSQLLQHIIKSESELDAIGTSFSATPEGLDFWQKNSFTAVRIGMTRHQSSGEHSVMLLHPVSEAGQSIMDNARNRMLDALLYHLQEPLADLGHELIERLSDTEATINKELSNADWQELVLFAYANRTYAEALGPLVKLANLSEDTSGVLTEVQQTLINAKVIQHKRWEEVVSSLNLDGQKHAVQILRSAVNAILQNKASKELMKKIDWVKQQIDGPNG